MLVGEGIETVLSIITAIPDTVAAAALSAGSLGAFAPPAGVTRLVIARDNDPEGERAAERLVRRCARTVVDTLVVTPEGEDFNRRPRSPSVAPALRRQARADLPQPSGLCRGLAVMLARREAEEKQARGRASRESERGSSPTPSTQARSAA